MVSLPVYDKAGKEIGKYDIDPSSIADKINKQLLHDVVVMYQANQRQGTRATKGRADVAGTTKKMYRQKGTGNARAGSRRSNIRRGGGHSFYLRTRDFSYRLPKKAVRLATKMAIAGKIRDNEVLVIDDFGLQAPKTREVARFLKAVGLEGKSALIATGQHDPVVYRSARNIENVAVSPVSDLNALLVIRPYRVVFTRQALDQIKGDAGK
ncbi:MAG: 50S ribosomal protein L4 [Pirellulaceae bacterium]|nr:50S ribosomal protein L4 [Pirellulaceae bacterium]